MNSTISSIFNQLRSIEEWKNEKGWLGNSCATGVSTYRNKKLSFKEFKYFIEFDLDGNLLALEKYNWINHTWENVASYEFESAIQKLKKELVNFIRIKRSDLNEANPNIRIPN